MKIVKKIIKKLFMLAVRKNFILILAPFISRQIRTVLYDGRRRHWEKSDFKNKKVVLALKPGLFRGDLEALASRKNLCVLEINELFQNVIVASFYPDRDITTDEFFTFDPSTKIGQCHFRCQKFFIKFLRKLYKIIPVDCVISANDRNQSDLDWGIVSHELKVAYIVILREGLTMTKDCHEGIGKRLQEEGVFRGTHIIFQNNAIKAAYRDVDFIEDSKCSVLGALRMDKFLLDIKKTRKVPEKKSVVLFYFQHTQDIFGNNGNYSLFKGVISTFLKMAKENKNIKFIIKPKIWIVSGDWKSDGFYRVVEEERINIDEIENLRIETTLSPSKLILNSTVCIGMHSSTVLEAGVAGKPVILPCFKEYRKSEYFERFAYRNHLHLFDVANNPDDFEKKVLWRLDHPKIAQEIINEREKVFNNYFSPSHGGAKEKYERKIVEITENLKSI